MYIYIYVRKHMNIAPCIHVCVCMHTWMDGWMDRRMYVCMYVCINVCVYACMGMDMDRFMKFHVVLITLLWSLFLVSCRFHVELDIRIGIEILEPLDVALRNVYVILSYKEPPQATH